MVWINLHIFGFCACHPSPSRWVGRFDILHLVWTNNQIHSAIWSNCLLMQQIGFSHIIGLCSDRDREMMIWTQQHFWSGCWRILWWLNLSWCKSICIFGVCSRKVSWGQWRTRKGQEGSVRKYKTKHLNNWLKDLHVWPKNISSPSFWAFLFCFVRSVSPNANVWTATWSAGEAMQRGKRQYRQYKELKGNTKR